MPAMITAIGDSLDRVSGSHLYLQIADLMRARMRDGRIPRGSPLPTQRELAAAWGIGEVTIRRALQKLGAEGLIEARPGIGTVVIAGRTPAQRDGNTSQYQAAISIGVAFADLTDGYPFLCPILAGLRSINSDVAIRLFDMPARELASGSLDNAPSLQGLDALIMMSPINLALLARCQQQSLPTVLLFSDVSDGFSHCVMPDYTRGVTEAVQHLARAGRRRLALVTAGPERFSTGRWIEAFQGAVIAHGLDFNRDMVLQSGYSERDGAEGMKALLNHAAPPDGVLFASDHMARGALLAAHEARIAVPSEIAIVGAGPTLEEGGWTVPLASINLGLKDMGRQAGQWIEAVLDDRAKGSSRQAVSTRFAAGATA